MHCARISLDVVQRSQYIQDLFDFCLLDQWARRILSVDELHEIPISVAIIVLVGVGVLLLRELLRVRDD